MLYSLVMSTLHLGCTGRSWTVSWTPLSVISTSKVASTLPRTMAFFLLLFHLSMPSRQLRTRATSCSVQQMQLALLFTTSLLPRFKTLVTYGTTLLAPSSARCTRWRRQSGITPLGHCSTFTWALVSVALSFWGSLLGQSLIMVRFACATRFGSSSLQWLGLGVSTLVLVQDFGCSALCFHSTHSKPSTSVQPHLHFKWSLYRSHKRF